MQPPPAVSTTTTTDPRWRRRPAHGASPAVAAAAQRRGHRRRPPDQGRARAVVAPEPSAAAGGAAAGAAGLRAGHGRGGCVRAYAYHRIEQNRIEHARSDANPTIPFVTPRRDRARAVRAVGRGPARAGGAGLGGTGWVRGADVPDQVKFVCLLMWVSACRYVDESTVPKAN